MDPVVSNSVSNTCGDTIGSNCVLYNGPTPTGLCGPVTLTQVVTNLTTKVDNTSNCCGGTFPPGSVSAYTGLWVNFPSIPLSGTWTAGSWTITNLGYSGTYYYPQYKWTPDGDLLTRGNFELNIISINSIQTSFTIPLLALSTINFPTNWGATNRVLTTVFSDNANSQSILKTGDCVLVLDYPTGILSLEVSFIDITLGLFSISPVNLNVRFNNA